jgi:hypothetical protein
MSWPTQVRTRQAEGIVKRAYTHRFHGETQNACSESGDEHVRHCEDTRRAIGTDGTAVRNPRRLKGYLQ